MMTLQKGLKQILLGSLFVLEIAVLVACGGGGGSSSTPQTGQMAVSLTDAASPECNFDNVFVTVTKVRIHEKDSAQPGDGGWIDITPSTPIKVDLLTLQNGDIKPLGVTSLPAARYNQVRLVLAPNTTPSAPFNNYVVVGGNTFPLIIPDGFTNGIKLHPQIDIPSGGQEELIIDFDVCQSIVEGKNGTYHFRPRLLTVRKSTAGGIAGFVSPADSKAVVKAEVIGPDGSTRYVYKQTRVRADGSFRLYPLPNSSLIPTLFPKDTAGTFDVVIVSDTTATVLTTGVPVTAGADTAISTSTAPIALAVSNSDTVLGAIDPTSADARIRQTINGNAYQIRRHPLNPFDGGYIFSLATEASSFGAYSATLPIAYTADNSSKGQYTLDTPNDDGLYTISNQTITLPTTNPQPLITLAPASGTAGSITGNLTLPTSATGDVLVAALVDDEIVNSIGVHFTDPSAPVPFTIDDLAPGDYTVLILHRSGMTQITPPTRSVTIPATGGTVTGNDFTLAP